MNLKRTVETVRPLPYIRLAFRVSLKRLSGLAPDCLYSTDCDRTDEFSPSPPAPFGCDWLGTVDLTRVSRNLEVLLAVLRTSRDS